MKNTHELELGAVTVTRIEEMHGPIMPPDQFFPDLPEHAWQDHRAMLVPDHLGADDAMVNVAMQTWLLRSEGRTILIDTGVGNDKTRPAVAGWDHLRLDYLGNLARAGVRPEDVDLVVNTRPAPTHAAGRLTASALITAGPGGSDTKALEHPSTRSPQASSRRWPPRSRRPGGCWRSPAPARSSPPATVSAQP